ncbi:hypothetical protein QQF64_010412 [Cirrhinus molitorella]|uniref:Uncharacterized protein n=1 Tax=Cirrhinus molitorella TaxID=172907 RepID=A0ABR3M408_9TELE
MNVMGAAAVPRSDSTIALSWLGNRSRHLHASLALPIQSCHDEHENGVLSGSITRGSVESRGRVKQGPGFCIAIASDTATLRFLWSGCSHRKEWTRCINQNSKEAGWGRMLAARLKRGPKKSCCQAAHSSNAERVASPGGPAGLSSSPVLGNTLA